MTFKVELQRLRREDHHKNPFLIRNIEGGKSHYDVRSWEFEADSEGHVRKLLDEAFEAKLSNVVGFTLRSIQKVESSHD